MNGIKKKRFGIIRYLGVGVWVANREGRKKGIEEEKRKVKKLIATDDSLDLKRMAHATSEGQKTENEYIIKFLQAVEIRASIEKGYGRTEPKSKD